MLLSSEAEQIQELRELDDQLESAGWTQGEALYNAVDKRRVEDVKRLLGQGQDPNDDAVRGHGEEQWTPLHRAAAHGHEEMIDALLRAGADVNAFNQRQSTPLHLASWSGHTLTVRQLVASLQKLTVTSD